ncbi:MAG: hypothetical protein C0600_00890 [Ignavibacteria bacterium]|nr:MAG: hypothetical protein C0600_00890 [Ignavibacteria bacterium]
MTFDEAMEKGFLNIEPGDADKVLEEIFDNDDPAARMDACLALLGTFVPREKAIQVLDLVSIIIDANEELEMHGGGDDEEAGGEG